MSFRIATLLALLLFASTPVRADDTQPIRVYLAGPLGFSETGRNFKDHVLIPELEALGYQVIDPWKTTDTAEITRVSKLPYGDAKRAAWAELDKTIGDNNERSIRSADLVVAVLDGSDVDSGTASEVGYAYAIGKLIIGYRSDFRLAGDNEGTTVNLQVERFIKKSGGRLVTSLDELTHELVASQASNENSGRHEVSDREDHKAPIEAVEAIDNFVSVFGIILALSLSESFKQFVSSKDDKNLHWERLPAFLGLVLLIVPFFQGMHRYFSVTYGSQQSIPDDYPTKLIVDSVAFIIEAAIFFAMSRALQPNKWKHFYNCVVVLFLVDSIWAVSVRFLHGNSNGIEHWLCLDIAFLLFLGLIYPFRERKCLKLPGAELTNVLQFVLPASILLRTVADYYFMWEFYFPQ